MKVYTDYGDLTVKKSRSYIIEVEGVRELTTLQVAVEYYKEYLENLGSKIELPPSLMKTLDTIKNIIPALETKNTMPVETFNIKKVKTKI